MIGFIIWIIGVVLCVKAVLENHEVAGRRREETISLQLSSCSQAGLESVFITSGGREKPASKY